MSGCNTVIAVRLLSGVWYLVSDVVSDVWCSVSVCLRVVCASVSAGACICLCLPACASCICVVCLHFLRWCRNISKWNGLKQKLIPNIERHMYIQTHAHLPTQMHRNAQTHTDTQTSDGLVDYLRQSHWTGHHVPAPCCWSTVL